MQEPRSYTGGFPGAILRGPGGSGFSAPWAPHRTTPCLLGWAQGAHSVRATMRSMAKGGQQRRRGLPRGSAGHGGPDLGAQLSWSGQVQLIPPPQKWSPKAVLGSVYEERERTRKSLKSVWPGPAPRRARTRDLDRRRGRSGPSRGRGARWPALLGGRMIFGEKRWIS